MNDETEKTVNANDVDAPSPRDIVFKVFITFDVELLEKRKFELKGFTMTDQNDRLRSYVSNNGLPLTRDDMALILRGTAHSARFKGILGDDWGASLDSSEAWGVQITWNNHHKRVYGDGNSANDLTATLMEKLDTAFNDLLRYAEQSLLGIQTLLTLSSIDARLRDGATVSGKGTKKAPVRKR